MVAKQARKTPSQIKEEILSKLDSGPLSVEQLRKSISDSNWTTINKYLEELKEEDLVKEIISTDKIKIYQKITGDTYFNLPLTQEERKKFRTLFYLIKKEYGKLGKTIPRTHFAKIAVHAIKQSDQLSELPTLWYLYGIIPLMIPDSTQDYSAEFSFKNRSEIELLIREFIRDNHSRSSTQLKKNQHKDYHEELYILSDEFLEMSSDGWEANRAMEILKKIYIACPLDPEFPEVFNFMDRFYITVSKLNTLNLLGDTKRELFSTFNALWKYIATYKAYRSLVGIKRFEDNKLLLDYNLGNLLEARKICFQESFRELYQIYLTNLQENKLEKTQSDDIAKVREILQDWTGED